MEEIKLEKNEKNIWMNSQLRSFSINKVFLSYIESVDVIMKSI